MGIKFDSELHTKVQQHSTGKIYVATIKDFFEAKEDEAVEVGVTTKDNFVIFVKMPHTTRISKKDLRIVGYNAKEDY